MRANQAFHVALILCSAACGDDAATSADGGGMHDASTEDAALDASSDDAAIDGAIDAAVDDGDASADDAGAASLCSGCADEVLDTSDLSIHLHHVHMNVADRARSTAFYQDFFDAQPTLLNGETEALKVGPMLLLLDEATEPPSGTLPTALQHVGWGSIDPIAWFEDAHARGVEPDTRAHSLFPTPEVPAAPSTAEGFKQLVGIDFPACFELPDDVSYIYVLGPDDERIEVLSGSDKHVNHMHFTTADMPSTVAWYKDFLDMDTGGTFFLDEVLFFFEPDGEAASYEPTDTHALGHIAFSVANLSAWRERVDALSIEVVAEPAEVHGFESFFVRGPDGLLIELVQAGSLSECGR